MNQVFGLHPFYELASIASVVALAMRNQLYLRFVLLIAYGFHIIDEWNGSGLTSLEHAGWNLVFVLFNGYVLLDLIYGRTTIGFSDEERQLFTLFVALSPGEFRKLIRSASWQTAERATDITTEGVVPDRLYFVYDGSITITKADRHVTIKPLTFIGEIAFLRSAPASASVTVGAGARWVEWSVPRLRQQLSRDPGLRTGFNRMIGEDLAQKVARA